MIKQKARLDARRRQSRYRSEMMLDKVLDKCTIATTTEVIRPDVLKAVLESDTSQLKRQDFVKATLIGHESHVSPSGWVVRQMSAKTKGDRHGRPDFLYCRERAQGVTIEAITIADVTTSEQQYTAIRERMSKVVRNEKGFTHVHNKNGSFYVISEESLNALTQSGFGFVITTEEVVKNNLAMYEPIGLREQLDLPKPDYSSIQRGVRPSRLKAVKNLTTSGNDDHAEHSG